VPKSSPSNAEPPGGGGGGAGGAAGLGAGSGTLDPTDGPGAGLAPGGGPGGGAPAGLAAGACPPGGGGTRNVVEQRGHLMATPVGGIRLASIS